MRNSAGELFVLAVLGDRDRDLGAARTHVRVVGALERRDEERAHAVFAEGVEHVVVLPAADEVVGAAAVDEARRRLAVRHLAGVGVGETARAPLGERLVGGDHGRVVDRNLAGVHLREDRLAELTADERRDHPGTDVAFEVGDPEAVLVGVVDDLLAVRDQLLPRGGRVGRVEAGLFEHGVVLEDREEVAGAVGHAEQAAVGAVALAVDVDARELGENIRLDQFVEVGEEVAERDRRAARVLDADVGAVAGDRRRLELRSGRGDVAALLHDLDVVPGLASSNAAAI